MEEGLSMSCSHDAECGVSFVKDSDGVYIDTRGNIRQVVMLDLEKARQLHEWLGRYLENCDEN